MYYNGEWGTVCGHGWDLNDANVVCTELGFGPVIDVRYNAFYGQGSGQIWLGFLNCVGTETTITDCSYDGQFIQHCEHFDDADVVCADPNGM